MNLYRSFGNLLEAWVTEGNQSLDSEWLGNNDEDPPTPSSDMGTNLRSASVDSGVETASSVMSYPATPSSISTDNTEIDSLSPERGFTPASTSPVLSSPSSSSLQLSPSRAPVGSTALHSKVEQVLLKTNSKRRKNKPLTVDEVLMRRPRSSFGAKPNKSELVRGQRSESLILRGAAYPFAPLRQLSETCRRPASACCDTLPAQAKSEVCGEEEKVLLSPGLCYLEQVCQMLEEIARQQMRSRALQMETEALQEHEDMESDFKAAPEEDLSSYQSLENTASAELSPSDPHRLKDPPSFRQRSASDTNITTMHLKKLNVDCRGQHQSIDDLLEKDEEDHEKQESEKEESIKSSRNWKLRLGSLTREESALRDMNGHQTQSSEKNSARRRLSQLFRRRKTLTTECLS